MGTTNIFAIGAMMDICPKSTIIIGIVNTIAERVSTKDVRMANILGKNDTILSKKSQKKMSQKTARNER